MQIDRQRERERYRLIDKERERYRLIDKERERDTD